ncbi:MAG: DUF2752 domain-containing protein [Acidobacteriota bacterium]
MDDQRREALRQKGARQLGLIWGAFALSALALSPWATRLASGLPGCPTKLVTGYPCPGCGTTRAALAMAHFDFGAAFAVSPLATVAWILFLVGGVASLAWVISRRPVPRLPIQWPWPVRIALALAVLGNWVYLVVHGS